MPIFEVIAAGAGARYMVDAKRATKAMAFIRRKCGTDGAPYTAARSSQGDLSDHLAMSGMVLRADGTVMPAVEAFAAAGLPAPAADNLTLRQKLGGGFPNVSTD